MARWIPMSIMQSKTCSSMHHDFEHRNPKRLHRSVAVWRGIGHICMMSITLNVLLIGLIIVVILSSPDHAVVLHFVYVAVLQAFPVNETSVGNVFRVSFTSGMAISRPLRAIFVTRDRYSSSGECTFVQHAAASLKCT